MHLEPPSVFNVSEVTCNESTCLKKHAPTEEHEEGMESNEVKIIGSTPTG